MGNGKKTTCQSPADQTLFGLLRHGTTEWNEQKRIQGRKNSPLSTRGRHDADIWGRFLAAAGWQHILSSDLGRAVETAQIINAHLGLEVTFDERLRELDWGEWEGLPVGTIKARHGRELERQVQAGWHFRAPGGESRKECLARTWKALTEHAAEWPQKHTLVVCHHGVIKCLVLEALGNSYLPSDAVALDKNALHILRFVEDTLACKQLNIRPDNL